MRVWRLCRRRHAAFDGEGARIAGGRWNAPGTPILYTSATLSLAALEFFVHLRAERSPSDLVAIDAELPEGIAIETIDVDDLDPDWRRHPGPRSLIDLGTKWARRLESAILSVPSVIVPDERNYLLNPAHPDFRQIRIGRPSPFSFDPRMWS